MRGEVISGLLVGAIVLAVPTPTMSQQDSTLGNLGGLLNQGLQILKQNLPQQQGQQQQAPQPNLPQSSQRPAASPQSERRMIAEVQAMLNSVGYDAGPTDGAIGNKTRIAIQQFQRDAGIPVTGQITPDLITRLQQATGARGTSAGAGQVPAAVRPVAPLQPPVSGSPGLQQAQNSRMVANAQTMLNTLGYNAGVPDGKYGAATRQAVQRFQKDFGVTPTGEVTPQLLNQLQQAASGTSAPQPASSSAQLPAQSPSPARNGSFGYSGTAGPGSGACAKVAQLKEKIRQRAVDWGDLMAAHACGKADRSPIFRDFSAHSYTVHVFRSAIWRTARKIGIDDFDLGRIVHARIQENITKHGDQCRKQNTYLFDDIAKKWKREIEQDLAALGPVSLCN